MDRGVEDHQDEQAHRSKGAEVTPLWQLEMALPWALASVEVSKDGTPRNDAAGLIACRKRAVRQAALTLRQSLSLDWRTDAEARLSSRLDGLCLQHGWQTVAVFWPWRGEPDLTSLWRRWHERGAGVADHSPARRLRLALPVVTARATGLSLRQWTPDEPWSHDVQGLPVPPATAPELPCDAVLIPCVAHTVDGFRMGSGGGYFDRSLTAWRADNPKVQLLGVNFSVCESRLDWREPHDLPLDGVVTD